MTAPPSSIPAKLFGSFVLVFSSKATVVGATAAPEAMFPPSLNFFRNSSSGDSLLIGNFTVVGPEPPEPFPEPPPEPPAEPSFVSPPTAFSSSFELAPTFLGFASFPSSCR